MLLLILGFAVAMWNEPVSARDYLVLVDPGEEGEFLPAARAMAGLHGGALAEFDPGRLEDLEKLLKGERARRVVFVLPPEKIDVELSRRIYEMSVRVDDDPFVDFEYGFVTGRDGAAAARFVERIAAGHRREWGRKTAIFGSWEGGVLPPKGKSTALGAMGLEGDERFVLVKTDPAKREETARRILAELGGRDSLLMFSHGYPDRMEGCYTGAQLREWGVDLSPAVVFNSSCYNGAPGRWWTPGIVDGRMRMVEQPACAPEDSAVLALLDAGVTGAFLGVDPWHGPLTCQVYAYAVDEGLSLGAAAKRMYDRLAMEFLPGRVEFPPVVERTVFGEGVENRRSNGAGMIFYGDPALTISPGRTGLIHGAAEMADGKVRVKITSRPMLSGPASQDSMVPMWRIANYYSARTADAVKELSPELYRVVELPEGVPAGSEIALKVLSARVGKRELPTGSVSAVREDWHGKQLLHVTVEVKAPLLGSVWGERIMREGAEVVLESE